MTAAASIILEKTQVIPVNMNFVTILAAKNEITELIEKISLGSLNQFNRK